MQDEDYYNAENGSEGIDGARSEPDGGRRESKLRDNGGKKSYRREIEDLDER